LANYPNTDDLKLKNTTFYRQWYDVILYFLFSSVSNPSNDLVIERRSIWRQHL